MKLKHTVTGDFQIVTERPGPYSWSSPEEDVVLTVTAVDMAKLVAGYQALTEPPKQETK